MSQQDFVLMQWLKISFAKVISFKLYTINFAYESVGEASTSFFSPVSSSAWVSFFSLINFARTHENITWTLLKKIMQTFELSCLKIKYQHFKIFCKISEKKCEIVYFFLHS